MTGKFLETITRSCRICTYPTEQKWSLRFWPNMVRNVALPPRNVWQTIQYSWLFCTKCVSQQSEYGEKCGSTPAKYNNNFGRHNNNFGRQKKTPNRTPSFLPFHLKIRPNQWFFPQKWRNFCHIAEISASAYPQESSASFTYSSFPHRSPI